MTKAFVLNRIQALIVINMLTVRLFKTDVCVTFGFLMLLALNTISTHEITICCLCFSLLHELSHLAAMKIFKVRVSQIKFYGAGIKISCCNMRNLSKGKKLAVYSAGCIANLLLCAALCFIDEMQSMLNLCIACFNLVPISYFDGGMMLSALFPQHLRALDVVSKLTFAAVAAAIVCMALLVPVSVSASAVIAVLFVALSELVG